MNTFLDRLHTPGTQCHKAQARSHLFKCLHFLNLFHTWDTKSQSSGEKPSSLDNVGGGSCTMYSRSSQKPSGCAAWFWPVCSAVREACPFGTDDAASVEYMKNCAGGDDTASVCIRIWKLCWWRWRSQRAYGNVKLCPKMKKAVCALRL